MSGWMDGWMDGWMGGWVDGWMGGWVDGWMGGWISGWMSGWMDAHLRWIQVQGAVNTWCKTWEYNSSIPLKSCKEGELFMQGHM